MGIFDRINSKNNKPVSQPTELPTLPEDHTLAAVNELTEAEAKYNEFCANILALGIVPLPKKDESEKEFFAFSSELRTTQTVVVKNFSLTVKAITKQAKAKKQKFLEVTLAMYRPENDCEHLIHCDGFTGCVVLTQKYPSCTQTIEVASPILKQGYVLSVTTFLKEAKFTKTFLSPEAGVKEEVVMPFANEDPKIPVNDLVLGFLPGVTHDQFLVKAKDGVQETKFTLQKLVLTATGQGNPYLSVQKTTHHFHAPNNLALTSPYGRALLGLRVSKER